MLIGLTGAAGAGKDTVARHLCESHGFVQARFADPLYSIVSYLTGISALQFSDREVKEKPMEWLGKSPRELLQLLGTEFGREMLGQDVWVNWLMRRLDDSKDCVITDVRFDNEAEAVRARGGVVVEVVRPQPLAVVSEAARQHSSEAGISDHLVEITIVNDGTIADLIHRADAALAWVAADTIKTRARMPENDVGGVKAGSY